ncbi:MAG: hypothetical protein P9X22_08635 [Candidatus Zapsychrus exili]|nr:hypothetical protein [Candidatus Zapsychrus exili]
MKNKKIYRYIAILIMLVVFPCAAFAVSTNFSVSKIDKLRADINDKRIECKLDAYIWNDAELAPGITPVRATHMEDLRKAILEVYELPPLNGTYGYVDTNMTMMKESHITEIQKALDDVICCGDGTCDAVENSSNCPSDCEELPIISLSAIAGNGRWIELAWNQPELDVLPPGWYYGYAITKQTEAQAALGESTGIHTTAVGGLFDEDIDFEIKYDYKVALRICEAGVSCITGEYGNVVSMTACEEGLLWSSTSNSCELIGECLVPSDCDDSNDCTQNLCLKPPPPAEPNKQCFYWDEDAGTPCNLGTGTCDGAGTCVITEGGYCGDGNIDTGEECDLGDQNSPSCTPASYGEECTFCSLSCNTAAFTEWCGDGDCYGLPEEDGNSCSDDCSLSCGDGLTEPPDEECDEGLDNGEECTPGWLSDCTYCDSDCQEVTVEELYCGDGIFTEGKEECDDGEANGQACPMPCGGECTYCDSDCTEKTIVAPYCGDGNLDDGPPCFEVCDDGALNGVQCSPKPCDYCAGDCSEVIHRSGGGGGSGRHLRSKIPKL